MGANKYENFECRVVKRSEIHGADYNPRTITDEALRKLKKWIKTEGRGLLAPITVNRNTMSVVSGHQRLSVLDALNKYPEKDYEITVALTELDEKTEVEANVFMNNKSAQGDFDFDMLAQIVEEFPDISLTEDFGFDESEVSLMFSELDKVEFNDRDSIAVPMGEGAEAAELVQQARQFSEDDYRASRRKELEKIRADSNTNGNVYLEKDDFTFTVVCISNDEKHKLMRLLHEKETEKFVKSNKLYDIYDHKIKLRELS